jgi:hypothetical protein
MKYQYQMELKRFKFGEDPVVVASFRCEYSQIGEVIEFHCEHDLVSFASQKLLDGIPALEIKELEKRILTTLYFDVPFAVASKDNLRSHFWIVTTQDKPNMQLARKTEYALMVKHFGVL